MPVVVPLPMPVSVAPLATVSDELPSEPVNDRTPALTLAAPEIGLLPLRVRNPVPVLRKLPVPLMTLP